MLFALGQLVAGSLLLLIGGEGVVRGASRLAIIAKLSPLFVGLTVVSLGTSAPEMAVSIATALDGKADITIGNVVGSNLFNMLMIVGFSAIVAALPVDRQVTYFDVPVMVAATIAMGVLGWSGAISRGEGVFLLVALCGYFWVSFKLGKRKALEDAAEDVVDYVEDVAGEPLDDASLGKQILSIALQLVILSLGVAALVYGCDLFVAGSIFFAKEFGVSEAVIGLTIVSAGTSLPELVTSVAATLKGERGIAIGNAVGSTILNILAVLGVTSVVSPSGINVLRNISVVDIPVMIAAAFLSWFVFRTDHTVTRKEGIFLVLVYCVYIGYLLKAEGAI